MDSVRNKKAKAICASKCMGCLPIEEESSREISCVDTEALWIQYINSEM
jgi:hypothetical protein